MTKSAEDLEFRVLGPLEVVVHNHVVSLGGPKPRALLAALLVNSGRPVPIDRLIDVLWGEKPPSSAVKAVQKYVSELRSQLPASLLTRPNGYVLEVADDQVDARWFEALIDQAGLTKPPDAISLLEEALAIWRGTPFPELENDDVAQAERARLEEARMLAIETLFQHRIDQGQHHLVIGALEEQVRLAPLREKLWGQLMLAYYRSGRQSEALRAFRRLAALLGEELGIEPSLELQTLEERILLHDPTLDAIPFLGPPRTNLRPRLNTFVGRGSELRELSVLLESSRLLTLSGPAGSGKTRLAIELAERQLANFPDGVWLIDLAPLSSPDQIADAVAKPFEISGSDERSTSEVLIDYLRKQRTLLVLDNCEHLIQGVASLAREMLELTPGLRILATTRERLGIPGERNYPVPPLPVPEVEGELESADSVVLFSDRARASSPQFEIGPDNRQAVAEICRKLDGIPLAIELAAARANSISPQDLVTHLDRRLAILGSVAPTASARHKTLRAAIDWSYELLGVSGRILFERLSVFRGGFDLESATRVCGFDPLEDDEVLSLLSSLVDKSLVAVDRLAGGLIRYRLLEMLREFGQEQVATSEAGPLRDSHARYFATMADAAATGLRGPEQGAWIKRISVEHDNIRKALRWADGQHPELVVRMAVALARFWDAVGPRAEGLEWLRRAVEFSDSMTSDLKVMARVAASDVYSSTRTTHSLRYAEEALAEARRVGDEVGEAAAQRALCWALGLDEQRELAVEAGLAALATFEQLGDRWEQAFSLERLGQADYRDPDTSTARLEKARSLYAEVGDRTREAVVLYKLAHLRAQRGDNEGALADAEMSIAISRELGSAHDESHALHEYGKILVRAGEPARGLIVLHQALEGLTKTGDERCAVRTLAAMGTTLIQTSEAEQAGTILRETLSRAIDVDDLQSIRAAVVGTAQLFQTHGRTTDAVRLYAYVNSMAHEGGLPLTPIRQKRRSDLLSTLKSRLEPDDFSLAWSQGEAMTIEDARTLVCGPPS